MAITTSGYQYDSQLFKQTAPSTGVVGFLRIVLLVALFFMRDGVPAAFAGMPLATTNYLVVVIIFLGCLKWLLTDALNAPTPRILLTPIFFLAYCVAVAAIASTFIFNYALPEWAIGQYLIAPILVPIFLYTLGFRLQEIVTAILWSAVLASALMIVDQIAHMPQLDPFYRRSVAEGDGFRRIVLLKNEVNWAMVYLLIRMISHILYSDKKYRFSLMNTIFICIIGYALFIIIESRLAIYSVLVSVAAFILFARIGLGWRIFLISISAFAVFTVLPFLLDKYIQAFTQSSDYLRTGNLNIRFREFEYYWDYFLRTYGMGFGVMSAGPSFSNFIAWSGRYMVPGYDGFGVQDLGIVGVLVQFGVIGFIWVIGINIGCLKRFAKAGRDPDNPNRLPAITSFCFMFGLLVAPLPMNFFTFGWTALFGWTLWYMSVAAVMENNENRVWNSSKNDQVAGKDRRHR